MRIVFDFDDTIAHSKECALECYREATNDYSTSIDDYSENGSYSYYSLMPQYCPKQIGEIFASQKFYDKLELYEDCVEVLKELKSKGCQIVICSGQRIGGIGLKSKFIQEKLPMVDEIVFITDIQKTKDSVVGDIFIDNEKRHLVNNMSTHKILFGVDCGTWEELRKMIEELMP